MKKIILPILLASSVFFLSSCANTSKNSDGTTASKSSVSVEDTARTDAETVLDFMYKGNVSGAADVLDESTSDTKDYIISQLEEKQISALVDNGNIDDYGIVVDGSDYSAEEIVKEYAEAYYKQISTIQDVKIKSVKVSGDNAKVTATITPIASLSEAHPIGEARTSLLGGIDNDTIIRESGNKDVKTIQKLITLKLYGLYYGQMGKVAEKADESKEITFKLKKDGKNFKADEETMLQLAKESRAAVYAENDTNASDDSSI